MNLRIGDWVEADEHAQRCWGFTQGKRYQITSLNSNYLGIDTRDYPEIRVDGYNSDYYTGARPNWPVVHFNLASKKQRRYKHFEWK